MKKQLEFKLTTDLKIFFNVTNINKLFNQVVNYVANNLVSFDMNCFFDVTIVNTEKMRAINRVYRKIDKPTDVISFALWDNNAVKTPLLGEIYICFEQTQIQAQENSHSFERELVFLFVHGLLHLLQYSHELSECENEMNLVQNEIMNNISFI